MACFWCSNGFSIQKHQSSTDYICFCVVWLFLIFYYYYFVFPYCKNTKWKSHNKLYINFFSWFHSFWIRFPPHTQWIRQSFGLFFCDSVFDVGTSSEDSFCFCFRLVLNSIKFNLFEYKILLLVDTNIKHDALVVCLSIEKNKI